MSLGIFERGSPSAIRQYVGASVVAAGYVGVDAMHKGDSLFASIDKGPRSDLYISLAASSAALLGFAITAASILLALGSGPRIQWLRQQDEFKQTRTVLMGAMRALALSTIVFTALIVLDAGDEGRVVWEVLAAAMLTAVITRLLWVLWLLNGLLRASIADDESKPHPNPGFTEPLDDV